MLDGTPQADIDDIRFAQTQIRRFAEEQRAALRDIEVETLPGVTLGHRNIPVNSVGCYVPGGRYPMVASAHMSVLTAKVAGVKRVVACTPPIDGEIPKATVCAMALAGADDIFILGGVQALAAMALGHRVDRARSTCSSGRATPTSPRRSGSCSGASGIDLLAGPTETLIIADDTADAEMVACDLLGQAEHGPTSPCALITTSPHARRRDAREIAASARGAADRGRRRGRLARLRVDHARGGRRRSRGRGGQAGVRARPGAHQRSSVLPRENDQLRRAVPGPGDERGLRRQGHRHEPHSSDRSGGAVHGGLWVGKFLKTCTYQHCTPEASAVIGDYAARLCELERFMAHREQALLRVRRYGA